MSANENVVQSPIGGIEKEDRPLKRQVDRQAKKINEVTARMSELEAEKEEQAELIGLLRDERDDALDEMNQTLELLEPWTEYVTSLKESKRAEVEQLSEALTKSQEKVTQLEEENQAWRQEMIDKGKVESHAFNILRPRTVSLAAVANTLGSNSLIPSHSKASLVGRRYTIEQMKRWEPAAVTQQRHGLEVATAIWRSLAPRNEQQGNAEGMRKPFPPANRIRPMAFRSRDDLGPIDPQEQLLEFE
ncbi:MAG: hypothetical protein LQ348_000545 [Seirophora lacunosa]|nr:MAG: hypothetical protein LQ348_000545 [Seirophora lacunosa]